MFSTKCALLKLPRILPYKTSFHFINDPGVLTWHGQYIAIGAISAGGLGMDLGMKYCQMYKAIFWHDFTVTFVKSCHY